MILKDKINLTERDFNSILYSLSKSLDEIRDEIKDDYYKENKEERDDLEEMMNSFQSIINKITPKNPYSFTE